MKGLENEWDWCTHAKFTKNEKKCKKTLLKVCFATASIKVFNTTEECKLPESVLLTGKPSRQVDRSNIALGLGWPLYDIKRKCGVMQTEKAGWYMRESSLSLSNAYQSS